MCSTDGQQHDHDKGLARDLEVIGERMMARRRVLAWFSGVGAGALVAGCGGGSGGSSGTTASASTTATTSGTTSTTTTTSGTTTTTTSSSGQCVADAGETNGPYPADGTNTSSGSTSNVLTQSGIVRSDIRSSFLTTTTTAPGTPLTLTLKLVNVNNSCAALSGYAIYVWHCDRAGNYSLYASGASESYLRGVQVTNANGEVTFTTIYPGCYAGRFPHIHLEVYTSLSTATSGRNAVLVGQIAMPAAANTDVYTNATGYTSSLSNYRSISIANDNVFGDNTAAQIAQQTPALTGSASAGYTGSVTIGIKA